MNSYFFKYGRRRLKNEGEPLPRLVGSFCLPEENHSGKKLNFLLGQSNSAKEKKKANEVVWKIELPGTELPLCSKCKQPIDQTARTGRVIGKARGSWICSTCNSRQVLIHRADSTKDFTCKFKSLPADLKEQFWREVADCHDINEAKLAMNRYVEKSYEKKEEASSYGGYQPLSWYAAQGYNTQDISDKCTDCMDHPILGKVYRVLIVSGGTSNVETTRRSDSLVGPSQQKSNSSNMAPSDDLKNQQQECAEASQQIAELKKKQKFMKSEATKIINKVSTEFPNIIGT